MHTEKITVRITQTPKPARPWKWWCSTMRSRAQVQADLDRDNPAPRKPGRR